MWHMLKKHVVSGDGMPCGFKTTRGVDGRGGAGRGLAFKGSGRWRRPSIGQVTIGLFFGPSWTPACSTCTAEPCCSPEVFGSLQEQPTPTIPTSWQQEASAPRNGSWMRTPSSLKVSCNPKFAQVVESLLTNQIPS